MNAIIGSAFLALLGLINGSAQAVNPPAEQRVQACINGAAKAFHIDALPLRLLREVEGGKVNQISRNRNGSYDIGPMQINSIWLAKLKEYGITEPMLRASACVNVYVGAWIFKSNLRQAEGNVAIAMARYHSRTPRYQRRYLKRIAAAIERRLNKLEPAEPAPTTRLAAAP
jgi:soluble lytic murein transglycosylase-like protein